MVVVRSDLFACLGDLFTLADDYKLSVGKIVVAGSSISSIDVSRGDLLIELTSIVRSDGGRGRATAASSTSSNSGSGGCTFADDVQKHLPSGVTAFRVSLTDVNVSYDIFML